MLKQTDLILIYMLHKHQAETYLNNMGITNALADTVLLVPRVSFLIFPMVRRISVLEKNSCYTRVIKHSSNVDIQQI